MHVIISLTTTYKVISATIVTDPSYSIKNHKIKSTSITGTNMANKTYANVVIEVVAYKKYTRTINIS